MSYEKQTFTDHETKLTAAHLEHIEDGIDRAFKKISDPVSWNDLTDKPFEIGDVLYEYNPDRFEEYEAIKNVFADDENAYCLKISDEAPSSDFFVGKGIIDYRYYGGEAIGFTIEEGYQDYLWDDPSGYDIYGMFLVITADTYTRDDVTYTKGVWLMNWSPYILEDPSYIVNKFVSINEAVIPDTIVRWSDMPRVREGLVTSVNGQTGDVELPATWDALPDKPFSVLQPTQLVTLTFDGNLDGREYVEVQSGISYVKLSDDTPVKESFLDQSVNTVSGETTLTITLDADTIEARYQEMTPDGEFIASGSGWGMNLGSSMLVIVTKTLTQTDGVTTLILEPGLWGTYISSGPSYISSLTYIKSEVISHLDEKFIPDTIARVDDVAYELDSLSNNVTDKLDNLAWEDLNDTPFGQNVLYEWDENTVYKTNYTNESGNRYDRITDGVFNDIGIIGKILVTTTLDENGESVSTNTVITEDMVTEYETSDPADRVYSVNGIIYLVCFLDEDANTNTAYCGTWVHSQSNGQNLYTKVQILEPVRQLDEKFIPDTVLKDGDKEFILTSSTEGSTKKFKITVDDSGVLTATEVVEE